MQVKSAYITGWGIVCATGQGRDALKAALKAGRPCFTPLELFTAGEGCPPLVGRAPGEWDGGRDLPRSHELMKAAVQEALSGTSETPEAVVVAISTGGMPKTETHLAAGDTDPAFYQYHGLTTVAEEIATLTGCRGPAVTVSTACSSGGVAIKIGLEMIRTGRAERVLVCGVDALCRLTFHGFNFLQLIDPDGGRPLDVNRKGLTLGEGAAALLLRGGDTPPAGAVAEIAGAGLSCDAYHPAAPHPQGAGAADAMIRALKDSGLPPSAVDYINLHGTGTRENDASEALAVRSVFGDNPPPLSSSKGIFGHTLAAAGVIEAAAVIAALTDGFLPANAGLVDLDPALGIEPIRQTMTVRPTCVLSNSFGFGGNNAAVVMTHPGPGRERPDLVYESRLTVLGSACLTGAGFTDDTLGLFLKGEAVAGCFPTGNLGAGLPPRRLRRLKRLTKMALGLTHLAAGALTDDAKPKSVLFGTGWGSLSETYDFLSELFDSQGQSASPIDFIGSVHNAPAGQAAMLLEASGPNITASGGDYSFEQALFLAGLLTRADDPPFLLLGADEYHDSLSVLLDPHSAAVDGGGALVVCPGVVPGGIGLIPCFFENQRRGGPDMSALVASLGGAGHIQNHIGTILLGLPAAARREGERQLAAFLTLSGYQGPIVDYRPSIGEFAAASAAATVLAVRLAARGMAPDASFGRQTALDGRDILLLTLGDYAAATLVSSGA